jgi:hypothetical protein
MTTRRLQSTTCAQPQARPPRQHSPTAADHPHTWRLQVAIVGAPRDGSAKLWQFEPPMWLQDAYSNISQVAEALQGHPSLRVLRVSCMSQPTMSGWWVKSRAA